MCENSDPLRAYKFEVCGTPEAYGKLLARIWDLAGQITDKEITHQIRRVCSTIDCGLGSVILDGRFEGFEEQGKPVPKQAKYTEEYDPIPVIIEWDDVQFVELNGLIPVSEIGDDSCYPIRASLIGFLVNESDEYYYIAHEVWRDVRGCKYLHIVPKRSVVKLVKLTKVGE